MFSGSQEYPTLPIDCKSMVTTDPAGSYTPRTLTLVVLKSWENFSTINTDDDRQDSLSLCLITLV